MTAFIVEADALGLAQAIAGAEFTVPLSADGIEPATHWGCNWAGCPAEMASALAQIGGLSRAEDWHALCQTMALAIIQPAGDDLF